MSDSAAPSPPRTSPDSSTPDPAAPTRRRRAAASLLLLLLLACAPATPPRLTSAPAPLQDPLRALDDAPHILEDLASVELTEGPQALDATLKRFSQRTSPDAHLLLHRLLLHAALYAELTQRDDLRQGLAARLNDLFPAPSLWDSLLLAFQRDLQRAPQGSLLALAAADAADLARLLRDRPMDPAYHQRLNDLTADGAPLAMEARLARILDLRDARQDLRDLPRAERLDALLDTFAPALCPRLDLLQRTPPSQAPLDDLRRACPLPCPPPPDPHSDLLTLAACGWTPVGWPVEAHPDLLEPRLAFAARLHRRAIEDLIHLHSGLQHPLARLTLPDLDALHAKLAAQPLPVDLRLDAPDDLPRLRLPTSAGDAHTLPHQPTPHRLVILDQDALRFAVPPALTLDATTLGFADQARHLQAPGRALASRRHLRDPSRHPDLRLALDLALDDADALRDPQDDPQEPLHLLLDHNTPLLDLQSALPLLADALTGRRPLHLALWAWADDAPRALPLTFLPGRPLRPQTWDNLPPEARPLDLTLTLTPDTLLIHARGAHADTLPRTQRRLDPDALRQALRRLAPDLRELEAINVEARGDDTRASDLLDLLDAIGALHLAAPPRILLFAADAGDTSTR